LMPRIVIIQDTQVHYIALSPSFKPLAYLSTGISVLGALGSDAAVSWAAALVAASSVAIPAAIDYYRRYRLARREEDAADTKAEADILAAEVVRRVQLEAEVRDARHKIRDLEQALAFMRAEHDALKLGVGKLDGKVKALSTPDPDVKS
jgi:hypothetical protein